MKLIVDVSKIFKTTPDSSREVSEIDEFIDKAKQNIDTAIFTINMEEKPLSEVADFLEMFVSGQGTRISSRQVSNFTSWEEDNERDNQRSGSANESE
ncbi:MAG: hypothetical protein WAK50_09365 [Nitrososphaeraceae archaeon]|jgi:predicted transcriptional regulator YheO